MASTDQCAMCEKTFIIEIKIPGEHSVRLLDHKAEYFVLSLYQGEQDLQEDNAFCSWKCLEEYSRNAMQVEDLSR